MRRTRFWVATVLFSLLSQFVGTPASSLEFEPVSPAFWPSYQGLSPQLEGKPNALRVWGPSRYETNLATSLLLRGRGVFPYASANSASESASNLSESDAWWGPGLCPRAVIIVAADLVADALSASVLSDPTGQSREPYLRRSAAADPLFDPVGGYSRVDTDFAPQVPIFDNLLDNFTFFDRILWIFMNSEQIFDDFQHCVRCRTPILARRRVRSTLNIIYHV